MEAFKLVGVTAWGFAVRAIGLGAMIWGRGMQAAAGAAASKHAHSTKQCCGGSRSSRTASKQRKHGSSGSSRSNCARTCMRLLFALMPDVRNEQAINVHAKLYNVTVQPTYHLAYDAAAAARHSSTSGSGAEARQTTGKPGSEPQRQQQQQQQQQQPQQRLGKLKTLQRGQP